jgi:hypothetical protein
MASGSRSGNGRPNNRVSLFELIHALTAGGRNRSIVALDEARRLNADGNRGPAYVCAVRAAEIFMRGFVLAPHFMLQGLS